MIRGLRRSSALLAGRDRPATIPRPSTTGGNVIQPVTVQIFSDYV
jgi:hypothetical protein